MEVVHFIYNEKEVDFLPTGDENVMVNATQMANIFGKRVDHFLKSDHAQAFIEALLLVPNSNNKSNLSTPNGGDKFKYSRDVILKTNKHIEILDANDENFKDNLDFALNTDGSSSDYENSRERPYNGQPWTSNGIRGKHKVKGLTMRDIKDCLIQAMLVSCTNDGLSSKVFEISDDPDIGKGTKYAAKGTWRTQDVYKIDFNDVDPIAIAQNLGCFIESYMGIYPNVNLEGIPTTDELIQELKSK